MIVHVTGDPADLIGEAHLGDIFTVGGQSYPKARVRKTDFHEAAAGRKAIRNNSKDEDERFEPFQNDEIVRRANTLADNVDFVLKELLSLLNGCEDFALGVRYGNKDDNISRKVVQ
nr:hypothetical protein BaRGS_005732 [Batillaria attramentaria]